MMFSLQVFLFDRNGAISRGFVLYEFNSTAFKNIYFSGLLVNNPISLIPKSFKITNASS